LNNIDYHIQKTQSKIAWMNAHYVISTTQKWLG